MKDPLPTGVDPTRLETYLSDSEFERVFAMTREAYTALPLWKAEKLKQDVGLF
jgi:supervillin